MFEKELAEIFKRIFAYSKVTYQEPGEAREQDCLFIEIESAIHSVAGGMIHSRVMGNCRVFAHQEKIPMGYFSKRIALADPEDTANLFFYDIDANVKLYQSLVQRSFSFLFLFSGQFDSALGTITSIETEVET